MMAMAIDAPEMVLCIGGKDRTLRFDNDQIRRTEICYAQATGVQMGYLGILAQAERKIFAALCALCYGAIASAEAESGARKRTGFAAFDAAVTYMELIDLAEDVVKLAVSAISAGPSGKKKPEASGRASVAADAARGAGDRADGA